VLVATLSWNVLDVTVGFSAVAPKPAVAITSAKAPPNMDPVDKTLSDLTEDATAFDPTAGGDRAAVTRNNKGEVWVPQVCI